MTRTFPLNRDIFPDHEYATSSVTDDRPLKSGAETALPVPAVPSASNGMSPMDILPMPKADIRRPKIGGHRKKKAAILTDTPEKECIEAEESSRVRKHPPPPCMFPRSS